MKRNGCGGVGVESGGESLISSAGAALLLRSALVGGLSKGLSDGLSPWRPVRSVHDPGKVVLDLAITIALGGDCVADAAVLRAQPELFGPVASEPTISRPIDALGDDPSAVIAAIRGARAAARAVVWSHQSPTPAAGQVVVDLDATLIGAHSEKEGATPNFKRGFGFHPIGVRRSRPRRNRRAVGGDATTGHGEKAWGECHDDVPQPRRPRGGERFGVSEMKYLDLHGDCVA
ncbi:hypothetical protein MSAS_56800 [Mycobacterium saskatchewanense]|nr:hypothetical protein MSAS_56800 [Mycobacterium saskatchewanense]